MQQPLGALPPLVFHSTPGATTESLTPTSAQLALYSQPSSESLREAAAGATSSDGEGSGFTPKQYRTANAFRPQLNGSAFIHPTDSFGPNQGYQTPTHQDIFGTRGPPATRPFDFDIGPNVPGPAGAFLPQSAPYPALGQLQPTPIGKVPPAAHMPQSINPPHLIQPPSNPGPRGPLNPLHPAPNGAAASSGQFMSPTQMVSHQTLQQAASALGLQYGSPAFNDLVSKLARQEGSAFQPNNVPQEEISTIFVVGFPDDMSVRIFSTTSYCLLTLL